MPSFASQLSEEQIRRRRTICRRRFPLGGGEHETDGDGDAERESARQQRAAPRPAVHGADTDHEQGSSRARPGRRSRAAPPPRRRMRREHARRPCRRAPASPPPRWKTSSPNSASLTGQSTSESAIGTQANASTWRARRYEPCEPSALHAAVEQPRRTRSTPNAAVEAAGDERPDRDEQPVVVAVVHQAPGGRGREHGGDPGEQDDREHRLGAVTSDCLLSSRSATNTGRGAWRTSTSAATSPRSQSVARAQAILRRRGSGTRPGRARRRCATGGLAVGADRVVAAQPGGDASPPRTRARDDHADEQQAPLRAVVPVHAATARRQATRRRRAARAAGAGTRPVYDPSTCATSSGVPTATISPPASPPSGPRSISQSACLITSRLCSITSTVLPVSTRRCSTSSSFSMSAKCRPVVGSSRM